MWLIFIWLAGSSVAVAGQPDAPMTLLLNGPPWPPYLNEQMPEQGMATDIVMMALKQAGYQVEVKILPWSRVLHNLEKGLADVAIGLWDSPERQTTLAYSDPYYVNRIMLIGRKGDAHPYHSLDDLKGLRIGVRQNARYFQAFDFYPGLNKIELPSLENLLNMLVYDRLDVAIGDHLIAQGMMKHNAELGYRFEFKQLLVLQPLHMGVRRSHPLHQDIIQRFNAQLSQMIESGKLQHLYSVNGVNESVAEVLERP